jgi:hypothetical protein
MPGSGVGDHPQPVNVLALPTGPPRYPSGIYWTYLTSFLLAVPSFAVQHMGHPTGAPAVSDSPRDGPASLHGIRQRSAIRRRSRDLPVPSPLAGLATSYTVRGVRSGPSSALLLARQLDVRGTPRGEHSGDPCQAVAA